MSIFNIKLKTKAGNDIKKKETFTVFFSLGWKKNALTGKVTAEYTYRMIYSTGIDDPKRVLELKNSQSVESLEDLTLKVILNFCHIIGQITKKHNIDPDFILFFSLDLEGKKNKSWQFLKDAFFKPQPDKNKKGNFIDTDDLKLAEQDMYDIVWTKEQCKKLKIKKEELDLLRAFADLNPNTKFMHIDPSRDKVKYIKSIGICNSLKDRIDRNLQLNDHDPKI